MTSPIDPVAIGTEVTYHGPVEDQTVQGQAAKVCAYFDHYDEEVKSDDGYRYVLLFDANALYNVARQDFTIEGVVVTEDLPTPEPVVEDPPF